MGNTACTASGSTPFEAEVVIVNHTSFTLKEPQTRKCSKCSQKHHLGLQMKQVHPPYIPPFIHSSSTCLPICPTIDQMSTAKSSFRRSPSAGQSV
eukprot:191245-Rhodomonas_salina.1